MIFYGWRVFVAVLIIEIVGPVGRYSMTAFFPYVSSELGWSRSMIGAAQTMSLWVYAIFVPFTGLMVDRMGGRKTFFLGGGLTFWGWIFLATIKAPWQLYVYYGLVMGMAVSLCHMVPVQATINKWFTKRAGVLTGLSSAAFGVGVSILIPLITSAAGSLGWRTTALIYGTCSGLVIMMLSFWVIRDSRESFDQQSSEYDGNQVLETYCNETKNRMRLSGALKTVPFWLLFATYGLLGIPLQGILAHLVMWGVDIGVSKAASGAFITAMFIPSLLSKVGGGWLSDRMGEKNVLFLSLTVCLLIMVWAWHSVHTNQTLIIFCVLMGLGYGLPMGIFTPYLSRIYGRSNVGALFGIVTMGHGLIGGCGPLLWGYIYDTFHDYNLACLISAGCYASALLSVHFIKPRMQLGSSRH